MHMKRVGQLAVFAVGLALMFASVANAQKTKFEATLAGKNEVPAVESPASGMATFTLSKSGKSIMYTLSVKDIEDVKMAHIHMGEPGQDGKPVAPLYPTKMKMGSMAMAGKMNGVIATGRITAASLVGPLKGKTINDLLEAMRSGKTYVNVHTAGHPGGEIRGTIE
jgi:CHRD domain